MRTMPPRFISTASRYSALWEHLNFSGSDAVFASTVNQVNICAFIPMHLPFPYPVKRFFWVNGATLGSNVDIGIYTGAGKKIWSSGSTAQAGATAPQYITPSPDFIIPIGRIYLGFAANNNTGFIWARAPVGREIGILQQGATFPLPADLSGAAAQTSALCVLGGFTMTGSGH